MTQSVAVLKKNHMSLAKHFDQSSYKDKNKRLRGVSFGLYDGATYIIERQNGKKEEMNAEEVEKIGKNVETRTKLLAVKKGDECVWKDSNYQEQ